MEKGETNCVQFDQIAERHLDCFSSFILNPVKSKMRIVLFRNVRKLLLQVEIVDKYLRVAKMSRSLQQLVEDTIRQHYRLKVHVNPQIHKVKGELPAGWP